MYEKALPASVLDSFARLCIGDAWVHSSILHLVLVLCTTSSQHPDGPETVCQHQSGVLMVSGVLTADAVKIAGDQGNTFTV